MHKIVSSVVVTALASSLALTFPAHAANKTQAATVQEAPLRAHLAFLASDVMEGRGHVRPPRGETSPCGGIGREA